MRYRALSCKVIVKVIREEKTEGGIIMLRDSVEHMAREEGTIVHIGDGCFELEKIPVKIGDKVCFARYGGKSLGLDADGNELRVMLDVDVLCVEEGK